jgi:starvation-inducible DNA-binding protein
MKPDIEITEKHLLEVATLLNTLLADEYVLFTKTRNAHWNVEGPDFMALHKFFEGQYEALDNFVDDVAERVRTLGHFALGSLKDFIAVARLSEHNEDFTTPDNIVETLLEDHETIIRSLRENIEITGKEHKDAGTADFLTGLMEKHEKMAWMLRAHLSVSTNFAEQPNAERRN